MDKETVKIQDLSTGYRTKKGVRPVTDKINASLYEGELTTLLGPNGAGKSTLLKTLSGFLKPLEGDIIINGKSLKDFSEKDLAKTVGVVLTEKPSADNMTVEDIVGLGRSPYTGFMGVLKERDRLAVDEAITLVGIEQLRGREVSSLSDGERQKVMIAKALAQETPLIFLDEPTAFLDYPSKVETMRLLRRLAKERGLTVFLSTHDMEVALQLSDRIWLLDKTYGVVSGTPSDLGDNGALARYFDCAGITYNVKDRRFDIKK